MEELIIIGGNRVGLLADIAERLGAVGANIESVSAQGYGEKAVVRIITTDLETAKRELNTLPGIKVISSPILVIELINRPGELGKVTRKLANKNIDLESVYVVSKGNDVMKVAIKPSEEHFGKAEEVLQKFLI